MVAGVSSGRSAALDAALDTENVGLPAKATARNSISPAGAPLVSYINSGWRYILTVSGNNILTGSELLRAVTPQPQA